MGLAARGSRQLGDQVEKIVDDDELKQVQRQARRVLTKALGVAILLTLTALMIPPMS